MLMSNDWRGQELSEIIQPLAPGENSISTARRPARTKCKRTYLTPGPVEWDLESDKPEFQAQAG